LEASSKEGYRFTEWTGDIESTDNPLSFTVVDHDYELTANFVKKSYSLTTNTEGEGAITEEVVEQKSKDYEHGTVVELTANPSEGYSFVEWTGDLTGSENPAQITVDEAKEVTAVFEATTGSVEVTTSTSGEKQDSDGYTFTIADKDSSIGINETITIDGLEEGNYDAELSGIADNCSVEGENPRTVDVTAGETAKISFNINCSTTSSTGRIAFLSDRDGDDFDIYTIKPNGDDLRQVTDNSASEYSIVWSPDNSRIAFSSDIDGNYEVYTIKPDGTDLQRVTNHSAEDGVRGWSQDGKLALWSGRNGDDFEIYTVDPNGENLQQVTDNSINDISPVWSPDGSRIAYGATTADNNSDYRTDVIRTIGPDGNKKELVTQNTDQNEYPHWSPDGSQIVFMSDRSEHGEEIYVIDSDGSNVQRLTNTNESNWLPYWSPGGSRIAFTSERDGSTDIYTITPSGNDVKRVTNTSARNLMPTWSR